MAPSESIGSDDVYLRKSIRRLDLEAGRGARSYSQWPDVKYGTESWDTFGTVGYSRLLGIPEN